MAPGTDAATSSKVIDAERPGCALENAACTRLASCFWCVCGSRRHRLLHLVHSCYVARWRHHHQLPPASRLLCHVMCIRLVSPAGTPLVAKQLMSLRLSAIWSLMVAFDRPLGCTFEGGGDGRGARVSGSRDCRVQKEVFGWDGGRIV